MSKCRLCNKDFNKPTRPTIKQFDNHVHALVHIVGTSIFEDVCNDRQCQDHANYEADQFDQYRKGE